MSTPDRHIGGRALPTLVLQRPILPFCQPFRLPQFVITMCLLFCDIQGITNWGYKHYHKKEGLSMQFSKKNINRQIMIIRIANSERLPASAPYLAGNGCASRRERKRHANSVDADQRQDRRLFTRVCLQKHKSKRK